MISSPGWAGRQCRAKAPGRRGVEQRVVEPVGRERGPAVVGRRLVVAHRDPHVGVDDVRAGDRGARVVGQLGADVVLELQRGGRRDAPPRGPRARRARRASERRCCRRRRRRAAGPVELAERLAQGEQVGQRLAGVVAGGEHVDHRHRARGRPARRASPRCRSAGRSRRRGGRGRARCRAPTRRARAAARRGAAPSGGRRARRCRPRTTCACASRAARRAGRRCAPSSAREAAGSAFSASARSSSRPSSVGRELLSGQKVARQAWQRTVRPSAS